MNRPPDKHRTGGSACQEPPPWSQPRILLIGYGNISRRDDGVAYHVLRRLQAALGLSESELETEPTVSGENPAMLYLHQLAPELAETIAAYDQVVFIDAHVATEGWAPVMWQPVEPLYQSHMVAHHLKPGVILALCESLYQRHPQGYMLSVLGHDFDFGDELSPETSRLADQAIARLQRWLVAELRD